MCNITCFAIIILIRINLASMTTKFIMVWAFILVFWHTHTYTHIHTDKHTYIYICIHTHRYKCEQEETDKKNLHLLKTESTILDTQYIIIYKYN